MRLFWSKGAAPAKARTERQQGTRGTPARAPARSEPQFDDDYGYEDESAADGNYAPAGPDDGYDDGQGYDDEPYDLGAANWQQPAPQPQPPNRYEPQARGPAPGPASQPRAPAGAPGAAGMKQDLTQAYAGEGWLTARGVKKQYGRRQVVKGVSLAVRRGEAVGLLGPNGAGKTTVFYMITGLVPADDGKILIDGNDATRLPMYRRARLGIGYLPQEASIFRGLTVEQNINAVLELVEPNRKKRKEQLDSLLEEFRITKLRKSPSIALSGGERRRCEIARALASRPSFILLDEPFAGIDPIAVGDIQVLVQHLTQRGIGVLITDHNVRETLNLIDRAYIIYDGQVLTQGTPEEVIADPDVRRVYLGDMKL